MNEIEQLRARLSEMEELLADKETDSELRALYQRQAHAEIERLKIELKESQWLTKQAVAENAEWQRKYAWRTSTLEMIAGELVAIADSMPAAAISNQRLLRLLDTCRKVLSDGA